MRASASHPQVEPRRCALEPSQVEAFFRRGWFMVRHLFTEEEVEALRRAFERLQRLAPEHDGDVGDAHYVVSNRAIRRVVWCGALEPSLLFAGRDPRILRPVAELLGTDHMDHLINQAHFKLPGDGVGFEWHQDSERRRYGTELWDDVNGKGSYVQTVIAVDDCRVDNGPIRLIPGNPGHLSLGDCSDEERRVLIDEGSAQPAVMAAGSVLFFGPYTIHGSEPNQSDAPRRILVNGFAAPGANHRRYPGCGLGVRLDVNGLAVADL